MKVKDLIEKLSVFNPDAEIVAEVDGKLYDILVSDRFRIITTKEEWNSNAFRCRCVPHPVEERRNENEENSCV